MYNDMCMLLTVRCYEYIPHLKSGACLRLPMLSLVKQTGHTKSPSTKSLVGYQVFLRRWGLPYLFSLEGAVHGEEFAESSFYFGSLQFF